MTQEKKSTGARTDTGTEEARRERIPVRIFDTPDQLSLEVAQRVADLVQSRNGQPVVLGLPTGSTPIGVYSHLIRMHQKEGLDLAHVVTFNLDEYHPIARDRQQSYFRFMREHFFDHVNIPESSIHIPPGELPPDQVATFCQEYEKRIREAGGLDLVLLGIGRSGHIGFNEPGSDVDTRTRLVILDEITRKDAASDFFGDENVPREAISMGVGTILEARQIILMATGEHKAPIIRRAVEGEPSREVTASFLQLHADATFYLDHAAAEGLTRVATPWLVQPVEWTDELVVRAVVWLAERVGKPILHLEQSDFHRHYLHQLTSGYDDTDQLCLMVFEQLRRRITYQDGLPAGEKVVVFSPHPDDDVISMGGMLRRLVSGGNDITVAYMTSGSVAVFDADVRRAFRLMEMTGAAFGNVSEETGRFQRLLRLLESKNPGDVDPAPLQQVKAFIRYAEAIAGIEVMGLGQDNARFLDMPFYKTGRVRKKPIGEEDVRIVEDLLLEVRPTHIFVAGDLSDPHGTHRMCYFAIEQALKRLETRPLIWLYRGAWQEWEIHRADVFIPLSKADLDRKIEAIFKHESQKDRAMYPGAYDEREFWERARDRNRETARRLDALGLPEFYAAEAFVQCDML